MWCNLPDVARLLLCGVILALLAACASAPVDSPAGRGRRVYAEHCASCHSLNPDLVIVGPSLDGVASRAAASGNAVGYLRESILTPGQQVVEGFDPLMPVDFPSKLSAAELEDLITFLMTLE